MTVTEVAGYMKGRPSGSREKHGKRNVVTSRLTTKM